jgi:hypothetical protein
MAGDWALARTLPAGHSSDRLVERRIYNKRPLR